MSMTREADDEVSTTPSPAHAFPLYGWKPNPELSDDENYMDVVFLITRSSSTTTNGADGTSKKQQGHMGSLIVQPTTSTSNNDGDYEHRILSNILGAATNVPLFGKKDCTSDIHAEISAMGQACQGGYSTKGCTCYITIPPCKRCFAALVAFGIQRIVARQLAPSIIRETAENHGIQVLHLSREQNRSQMQRINALVNSDKSDQELMMLAERNKQRRQEQKQLRKQQQQERRQIDKG